MSAATTGAGDRAGDGHEAEDSLAPDRHSLAGVGDLPASPPARAQRKRAIAEVDGTSERQVGGEERQTSESIATGAFAPRTPWDRRNHHRHKLLTAHASAALLSLSRLQVTMA